MNTLPGPDWKLLREFHPVALERFCQRVLEVVTETIADSTRSSHERYLAVSELIDRQNREMAAAFDDMRRSVALQRIAKMHALGVLSDDEFARFSEPTRESVESFLGISST